MMLSNGQNPLLLCALLFIVIRNANGLHESFLAESADYDRFFQTGLPLTPLQWIPHRPVELVSFLHTLTRHHTLLTFSSSTCSLHPTPTLLPPPFFFSPLQPTISPVLLFFPPLSPLPSPPLTFLTLPPPPHHLPLYPLPPASLSSFTSIKPLYSCPFTHLLSPPPPPLCASLFPLSVALFL